MRPPILWSRLGNAAGDITTPAIGNAIAINSTYSLVTGHFGGLNYDNNTVGTSSSVLNPGQLPGITTAGCIEVWVKAGTQLNIYDTIFDVRDNAINGSYCAICRQSNILQAAVSGWTAFSTTFNPSVGKEFHVAFVFDTAGINGTSTKQAIYVDGLSVGSTTTAPPSNQKYLACLGGFNNGQRFRGTYSNLKVYPYSKFNFNDRFAERGGLNDLFMTAGES